MQDYRIKGNTLVLCDNYGQAGATKLLYKTENRKQFLSNADYINWFDLTKKISKLNQS